MTFNEYVISHIEQAFIKYTPIVAQVDILIKQQGDQATVILYFTKYYLMAFTMQDDVFAH